MRTQVLRQRSDIRQVQRAGIPTASSEAPLERMLNKIDELCNQRAQLKRDLPPPAKGKSFSVAADDERTSATRPILRPWIRAVAEVRLAPREGWCYQHVQAIIVAIEQYG